MNVKFFLASVLITTLYVANVGCHKAKAEEEPDPLPDNPDVQIKPQVDPPIASTIGFFLDDWIPVNFSRPTYKDTAILNTPTILVNVDYSQVITKIPRSFSGDNSNLWMGQIVTENNLVKHITNLKPHLIRFPGGSISNKFFWNANPNQAPADAPKKLIEANGTVADAGFWYGKNADTWTFSVGNYYNLLQRTNSQGIITINYSYARYSTAEDPVAAAAHLAADWVRYDNGRTQYWEIGNENYGDWEAGYRINTADNKDGQPEYLTGQLYGQHFNVFVDSMKKAAQEIGKTIYIGAVMVEAPALSWETNTRKNWNTGMLGAAKSKADFYVVHNYYTDYQTNANATTILNTATKVSREMMTFVKQTLQQNGAAEKPVVLDEWNIFSTGSMQQVSHINGMHAVLVLAEVLKSKYGMSSRWDLANAWESGNDHGLFSQGDEPGGVPKWTPRPAYYHMYFLKKILGDRIVAADVGSNTDIETIASSFSSGDLGLALVNKSTSAKTVEIKPKNFLQGNRYYWYTLTGGTDNGEFSRKVFVNGKTNNLVAGGPTDYETLSAYSTVTANRLKVTIPARSVVCMVIEGKK